MPRRRPGAARPSHDPLASDSGCGGPFLAIPGQDTAMPPRIGHPRGVTAGLPWGHAAPDAPRARRSCCAPACAGPAERAHRARCGQGELTSGPRSARCHARSARASGSAPRTCTGSAARSRSAPIVTIARPAPNTRTTVPSAPSARSKSAASTTAASEPSVRHARSRPGWPLPHARSCPVSGVPGRYPSRKLLKVSGEFDEKRATSRVPTRAQLPDLDAVRGPRSKSARRSAGGAAPIATSSLIGADLSAGGDPCCTSREVSGPAATPSGYAEPAARRVPARGAAPSATARKQAAHRD
jgi:hypothetical protein